MRQHLIKFGIWLSLFGCATPYNYQNFYRHKPKSILVLPPINNGTDVRGTYGYLSTLTKPIAEKGFYVFPVVLVDHMMKENGLPTAHEMHQVSLKKLHEIIQPDAVLYLTLDSYGTKYVLIDSQTNVSVSGKLIDTKSGTLLWDGKAVAVESGSGSGGSLLGTMLSAAVSQAINSTADRAHEVSESANQMLFDNGNRGLLNGPYHIKPAY
jgi:hypothetical protein